MVVTPRNIIMEMVITFLSTLDKVLLIYSKYFLLNKDKKKKNESVIATINNVINSCDVMIHAKLNENKYRYILLKVLVYFTMAIVANKEKKSK